MYILSPPTFVKSHSTDTFKKKHPPIPKILDLCKTSRKKAGVFGLNSVCQCNKGVEKMVICYIRINQVLIQKKTNYLTISLPCRVRKWGIAIEVCMVDPSTLGQ